MFISYDYLNILISVLIYISLKIFSFNLEI